MGKFILTIIICSILPLATTAQWCDEKGNDVSFFVVEYPERIVVQIPSGQFETVVKDSSHHENYITYQCDSAILTLYYGRNLENLHQQANFEQAVLYYKGQILHFYFCPLTSTHSRKIKSK